MAFGPGMAFLGVSGSAAVLRDLGLFGGCVLKALAFGCKNEWVSWWIRDLALALCCGEVWRERPPVSGEPGAASLEFINTSL